MKSMEEYISNVYAKYEETESKNQIYKTVKLRARNPFSKLYAVTACLALVCVICIGVNYFKPRNNEIKNGEELNFVSSEIENDGSKVFTKIVKTDYNFIEEIRRLIKKADCIALVSDAKKEKCSSKIKNQKVLLETYGTLKIEKIIKGPSEDEKQHIKFLKSGGKICLADLEKDKNINWEKWELINIGDTILEEDKDITYYQQLPSKGIDFEKEKQYLVFMKYNEEKQIYEITDMSGIIEYDPSTQMIKNIDTGEFEEFDWSLIS